MEKDQMVGNNYLDLGKVQYLYRFFIVSELIFFFCGQYVFN